MKMRPTTAKATRSPHRAAIAPSWRPFPKKRVPPRVEKSASRLPVGLRATAVQPLDVTAALFATLSSVAAVENAVDNDDDIRRPAIAFTTFATSTSSSSSSSAPSASGRGLVATRALSRREVALRVPGSICLVVDYSPRGSGLSLPEGGKGNQQQQQQRSTSPSWPRTSAAVAKDPSTPWDFLLALALLDAVSGDGGGEWWESFSEGVLPQPSIGEEEEEGDADEGEDDEASNLPFPSLLTLPLCLPQSLLALTGHKDLERAALEQQRRLAETYPALAIPASASSEFPTMMQWALACVRSRAFSLSERSSSGGGDRSGGGGERASSGGNGETETKTETDETEEEEEEDVAFAFVPLIDCANHAQEPAATYRPVWKLSPDKTRRKLEAVELVMLRAVAPGEEVTISYLAGPVGATNRRLFSLYGFVPVGGNPGDRVEGLEVDDIDEGETASSSSSSSSSIALNLDLFMDLLGPQVSRDIMQGKNPYLFAAIKSLPLRSGSGGGGGSDTGIEGASAAASPPSPSSPASSSGSSKDHQLARSLLAKVEQQLLEVEQAAALQGRKAEDDAALAREAEAAAAASGGRGAARAAVLRYRAERGSLLRAARAALRLYSAATE